MQQPPRHLALPPPRFTATTTNDNPATLPCLPRLSQGMGDVLLARRRGASYAFHFVRPDGGQLAQIAALVEAGSIRPVIDQVFPFLEAKQALACLAQGRARGKVVVRMTVP